MSDFSAQAGLPTINYSTNLSYHCVLSSCYLVWFSLILRPSHHPVFDQVSDQELDSGTGNNQKLVCGKAWEGGHYLVLCLPYQDPQYIEASSISSYTVKRSSFPPEHAHLTRIALMLSSNHFWAKYSRVHGHSEHVVSLVHGLDLRQRLAFSLECQCVLYVSAVMALNYCRILMFGPCSFTYN